MNIIQFAFVAIELVTATPVSSETAVRTFGGVFAVPSGGVDRPSSTIEDGAMAKDIASASPRETGHADAINGLAERRGGETSSLMRGASVLDADALNAKLGSGRMPTSPKTDSINIGRQFNKLLETTCTGGSDEFAAGDGGDGGVLYKALRSYEASENVNKYGSPVNCWKVGAVTNFDSLFFNATSFNQDVSSWNTSQVTDMTLMFAFNDVFNQALSSWDTGQVTSMYWMFLGAYVFNQPLSSWNTGQVNDMHLMFSTARKFNQALSSWNTSQVTDMSGMFYAAKNFNQDLRSWGQNYNSRGNYGTMFVNSGCPNQGDPSSIEGPWCYPIPPTSTSTSPSESPSAKPSMTPSAHSSTSPSAGTRNVFSLAAMMFVFAYTLG